MLNAKATFAQSDKMLGRTVLTRRSTRAAKKAEEFTVDAEQCRVSDTSQSGGGQKVKLDFLQRSGCSHKVNSFVVC